MIYTKKSKQNYFQFLNIHINSICQEIKIMSQKFCLVMNCGYSQTHITQGHKCGKCNDYGHGQIECGDAALMEILKNKIKDNPITIPFDMQCKVPWCGHKNLHTTVAHCSKKSFPSTNYFTVVCPTCRTKNFINKNQMKVFGITEKCSICYENVIDLFLPNCGHTNICYECTKTLSKTNYHHLSYSDDESVGHNDLEDLDVDDEENNDEMEETDYDHENADNSSSEE